MPIRFFHRILLCIFPNFFLYNLIHIQPAGICHQNAVIQYIRELFPDFVLFLLTPDIIRAPLENFQQLCRLQADRNRQILWIVKLFPVSFVSEF